MKSSGPFFTSDEIELQQEFLRNIKVRSIEQKFLYFGDGVRRYYNLFSDRQLYSREIQKQQGDKWAVDAFEQLLEKHISRDKTVGLISLGCGEATEDKYLMNKLYEGGSNFTWIGFDSSSSMIERAKVHFKDVKFKYELHVDDITTYDFYKKVQNIMKDYDQIIVVFIGGTIGNMIQTEIIDTVYNLMNPGDLLWFDCVTRESDSKTDNLDVFNKYANRLNYESWVDFISHPLDFLNISRDVGELVLENTVEESIGVLNFRYSFRFTQLYTTRFMNEYIHFVPPESLKLLDVRTYHTATLIKYLEQHNLKHLDSTTIPLDGQFLFTKKTE